VGPSGVQVALDVELDDELGEDSGLATMEWARVPAARG